MRRPKGTAPQLMHAAIGLVGFFACYARTFVLPHTPILFWGDQMLYATNGARIVAGQMPYRDFFEFLPAGTDLAYALLFQTFGVRLWIPNLLMVVLATAALLLTTLAEESILKGPSASCRQCSVWGVLPARAYRALDSSARRTASPLVRDSPLYTNRGHAGLRRSAP